MSQRIWFRADAATWIGIGHIMRCLALADALAVQGADCRFICRYLPGNAAELIRARGYPVFLLGDASAVAASPTVSPMGPSGHWLGVSIEEDARQSLAILTAQPADWLVVDHYGLDARWETLLRPACLQLMVLDDLANRAHDCDLLLDQTLGRDAADYQPWTGENCRLLCGAKFALLHPDFSALRSASLQRRQAAGFGVRSLLVSMGGIDADNATGAVLSALADSLLPRDIEVTVVMGQDAPWLAAVTQQVTELPFQVQINVAVSNMAALMRDADLAIGAAGSTSWERCCLGLPAVMLVLADNQQLVAARLQAAGAVVLLPSAERIEVRLPAVMNALLADPPRLQRMSAAAAQLVDGLGVRRVLDAMEVL